jgi:nitrite reductase/ring-hydroxylating ferredoxin subunit
MAENKIRVAAGAEIREGELHAAEAAGQRLLLTRVDGQVYAVINRCPHMGMKMTRGEICDGVLKCPWHGSRFDVRTGENVDWVNAFAGIPMPKWTHGAIAMGKAPAPLQIVPVEEDGDGVHARLPG